MTSPTTPRDAIPNCGNCKFSIDDGRSAVCRRHPPLPVLMRGETYDPDTLQGYWPRVDGDDWCGEWQPNEQERTRQYNASMSFGGGY